VRLAVDVTPCTARRAGVGYYTEHLVDALLRVLGPDDDVVLCDNGELDPELARRWRPHLVQKGRARRAAWLQLEAPRLIADARADVAIFPSYMAPLVSPCPYAVFVHDLALWRTPGAFTVAKRVALPPLVRAACHGAFLVGTVSEASRRDIVEHLAVPSERVLVLPGAPHPFCRPVDEALAAPVLRRHGLSRPFVLSVGTLEPRKNLPALLAAFDQLVAQGRELDLVVVGGRGWRDGELADELQKRRAQGRVHWLGRVSESDLAALYSSAQVAAYPSLLEGFGLPVLEAMASGTPVVASDTAALREVSGGAAVLVPPTDVAALAGALGRLLDDPAERARRRQAGLSRAAGFRWEDPARALLERCRTAGPPRVVTGRPRPGPGGPPTGRPPEGIDEADWAILATMAYSDLFDYAPTSAEVANACLGASLDEAEVRRRLARPPLQGRVVEHEGYLVFAGRQKLVERRHLGARRTVDLLERHKLVLGALASLPFIRMMGFSGGTAHKNSIGKDDIDLFVVAARGHAFTVYTLLFLLTKLSGTRPVVCPNYLIDEDHLAIAYHRDMFTAHQLISVEPFAGKPVFDAFTLANRWVRQFYPGYTPRDGNGEVGMPAVQRTLEAALKLAGPLLEAPLRAAWRTYLGRRTARATFADVVLSDGVIKLHFSDYRRVVTERYRRRLEELREHLAAAGSPLVLDDQPLVAQGADHH
jgi:glycosyltransferase involved in cell wall biosynthesis